MIYAIQGAPLVLMTPVVYGEIFLTEQFFFSFFTIRCRQSDGFVLVHHWYQRHWRQRPPSIYCMYVEVDTGGKLTTSAFDNSGEFTVIKINLGKNVYH
jgi:hypothetical protein